MQLEKHLASLETLRQELTPNAKQSQAAVALQRCNGLVDALRDLARAEALAALEGKSVAPASGSEK